MTSARPATKPKAFASGTTVTAFRSLEEIEKTVSRFGATEFMHAKTQQYVVLMFNVTLPDGTTRRIRYTMSLPQADDFKGVRQDTRTPNARANALEDETNRRWRALAAGIKGKLVLVESGIETLEQAFYANIVADGSSSGPTIYEATNQQIAHAYRTGTVPPLLPGIPVREYQVIEGDDKR